MLGGVKKKKKEKKRTIKKKKMRLKDENIFFFAPTLRVKYEFQISKLGSVVVKVKCLYYEEYRGFQLLLDSSFVVSVN